MDGSLSDGNFGILSSGPGVLSQSPFDHGLLDQKVVFSRLLNEPVLSTTVGGSLVFLQLRNVYGEVDAVCRWSP